MRQTLFVLSLSLLTAPVGADVTIRNPSGDITVKDAGAQVSVSTQGVTVNPHAPVATAVPPTVVVPAAVAVPQTVQPVAVATATTPSARIDDTAYAIKWSALQGAVRNIDHQGGTLTLQLTGSESVVTVPVDPLAVAIYKGGNPSDLQHVAIGEVVTLRRLM
jgi:hypothetical protein